MTRQEFIRDQAARLQVAAIGEPRYQGKRGELVAGLCIKDAARLADALGLTDAPKQDGGYSVPKAMADDWVAGCENFRGEFMATSYDRPLYDCLKAQQEASK